MGKRYPTQHGRVEQIDVLRGLAIVLVVFGHVTQGLRRIGKIETDGTFDFLGNDWVYLFHMPAFFSQAVWCLP